MDKLIIGIGALFVAFIIIVTMALIVAFPLMWAWNYVIPALFGLAKLTFWQAFSLYIVSGLLIRSKNVAN